MTTESFLVSSNFNSESEKYKSSDHPFAYTFRCLVILKVKVRKCVGSDHPTTEPLGLLAFLILKLETMRVRTTQLQNPQGV